MSKKFTIDLPGSEFTRINAAEVKLSKSSAGFDGEDRLATLKFSQDGINVKLYMMESDLRILAGEILANTNPAVDD